MALPLLLSALSLGSAFSPALALKSLKMRVVVFHPGLDAPPDAAWTEDFVSLADREPPYFLGGAGVVEELDHEMALASWASPTHAPSSSLDAAPDMQLQEWPLVQLFAPGETAFAHKGTGVKIFVLDSGCEPRALDSKQKPGDGKSFAEPFSTSLWDAHGHGTFMASVVLRAAPDAELVCVRVADAQGRLTLHSVAFAMAWVASQGDSVLNLSAKIPAHSKLLDALVEHLVKIRRVAVSVAHSGGSSLKHAVSTGTELDESAEIQAPGLGIVGANAALYPPLTMMTGSSVSAAWTAGVLAQIRGARPNLSASGAHRMVMQLREGKLLKAPGKEFAQAQQAQQPLTLAPSSPPTPRPSLSLSKDAVCFSDALHPNARSRLKCAEHPASQQNRRALKEKQERDAPPPPPLQTQKHVHPRAYHAKNFLSKQ